jgi:wyosine [tRNA(Phe)-imidazoG37] synthetase (radical SAM superfamily)
MKYTFGPILSRRFGLSLGIDLSPSKKICNFDCLYCELPHAKITDVYNNDNIIIEDLIDEVKLKLNENPKCDVITITANGEPTLYPKLEIIVDELNQIKGDKKLLILSNSSTIMYKNIRKILAKIDIVKLSLDTVNQKVFKKIDRGLDKIQITDIINGILEFKLDFKNSLVIEVLIVKNINDNYIEELSEVLNQINSHRVDLSTIDRPPAFDVQPISFCELESIANILSKKNRNINIASRKDKNIQSSYYSKDEILHTLSLRPFSIDDYDMLFDDKTKQIFDKLIEEKKILEVDKVGLKFYILNL